MRQGVLVWLLLMLSSAGGSAQQRPEFGRAPDPGPNRIEVRFALGEQAVTCSRFRLTARHDGRVIFRGRFAGGFEIPEYLKDLPRKDALELEFQCGHNRWHFREVPERAFLRGYWWVGTDYPPFQSEFRGSPHFRDAAWIRYLMVNPREESGFDVYKYCPKELQGVKPGPCDTD